MRCTSIPFLFGFKPSLIGTNRRRVCDLRSWRGRVAVRASARGCASPWLNAPPRLRPPPADSSRVCAPRAALWQRENPHARTAASRHRGPLNTTGGGGRTRAAITHRYTTWMPFVLSGNAPADYTTLPNKCKVPHLPTAKKCRIAKTHLSPATNSSEKHLSLSH